ncbi:MAG: hypothetical protein NVSMB1_04160 [Polyangiales bacterium]
MSFSTILLLLTGLLLFTFVARLLRTPGANARDWWMTCAAIALVGLGAYWALPSIAGYIVFGACTLLLFAPLRLDRQAQAASRRGQDARARTLSTLAVMLHPFGVIRTRPASIATIASLRAGEPLDEAMLAAVGAQHDPILREWYRVVSLSAVSDYPAIRRALSIPTRRARLLHLGLGVVYLRAVADAASLQDIVSAIEEVERHDPSLEEGDRRAAFALEACAALGDVEGARRIGSRLLGLLPQGSVPRAIAAAQRASGDPSSARQTVVTALERGQKLDAMMRRTLVAIIPTLEDASRRVSESPASISILARLHHDADAFDALAVLRDGSRVKSYATWAIAALIALHFAITILTGDAFDSQHLVAMGGLTVPLTRGAESFRLITSAFVHAGWLHLLLNLYALLVFGRFVEAFFGRTRMLVIYFAASIGSGLAVAEFADAAHPTVLVGASGAIFGLAGAIIAAVAWRADLRNSRRGREELRSFAVLIVLQIIFDRIIPGISGTAHIAGLITGALLGSVLIPRRTMQGATEGVKQTA